MAESQDEEAMNDLLQRLQRTFQDPSLRLLKAWHTANGTIGLCRSQDHGYRLIGILVHGKVWHVQYRDAEAEADLGAEIIAAFAGAEEDHGS